MSPYDSFTFPEFLPLGLIVRPYGGIRAEPADVKDEDDLPCRFTFGCLEKGSFRKTASGWSASYRHPTPETCAEVAYRHAGSPLLLARGEVDGCGARPDIYGRASLYLS
jgi:hypothetical protein